MKKLVEEGKVKYLGLSEASADTIRRAARGAPHHGRAARVVPVVQGRGKRDCSALQVLFWYCSGTVLVLFWYCSGDFLVLF